jgi:2-C-methyl-D-erythritol 2,4-cyclodiphosphate synthase
VRIGIGYDVHALVEGRPLVVGGVTIPHARGLAGHSDADVLLHAICDALLGAAGLGDIGSMFPSDDPELRGVSSLKLLREAYAQVLKCGWKLGNADVVLIGNEPKVAPVRTEMETLLLSTLDGDGVVTVRATTTDGLGFTGRGDGLAAQAVALLERVA